MRIPYYCLLLCLLLSACKDADVKPNEDNTSLYPAPITVLLDTVKGYNINPLTADSVRTLLNSNGDTVITGIPFSITGQRVELPGFKNPITIKDEALVGAAIESNIQTVQGKPETATAVPDVLTAVEVSPGRDSIILPGSSYIIHSRKILTVTVKKNPLHEPQPVKIEPMRYKDNALLDIQYLDIGQGLAYSYIYAMYQDKNGFLWLGTDYGLCKYDGTYLTTYTEKNGLLNNKVNTITGDNQGRLWIGTYKGLTVFDGSSFLQFTDGDRVLSKIVSLITRDSMGNMLFTLEGFGTIGYDGNKFILHHSNNNFRELVAPDFFADSKGGFWFLTPGGLVKYDGRQYTYFHPGSHILNNIILASYDSKDNIWFTSFRYGITKYDGNVFTHYTKDNGISDDALTSAMIDKNDNVWIGTRYDGLNKFDGLDFTSYKKGQGLSENKILCTLEDKQGNIWVGTAGGGINKLNDKGFTEKISLDKFNNSRVRPIVKDKSGNLWFGTEGAGLYSINGKNLLKHIGRAVNNIEGFRSVMTDKEGNLWFGLHNMSGIYKYDYKQFYYYYPEKKVSSLLSLLQDKNQVIWIGTSREGVASFNGSNLTYYNETAGFPSNSVFVTIQDKKNNLWFGTEGGGLVKYDGKMFTVFCEKQGLFAKSITSIIEDEKGDLWLGTLDAGLCKFDGNRFTYYGEKQGMAFKAIWSLKEDANRQIWAGTDNGLSVLVPQKDTVKNKSSQYSVYSFGLQDGLKSTDFNLNGVYIDNNNRIWWGTGKALITRDLNTAFTIYKPFSLSLSSIEINEEYYDFRNLSAAVKKNISFDSIAAYQNYPANLSLPYNLNHLRFHFSAIDWSAPHKIKYSYRMIGLDEHWSTPTEEPIAEYRNLSYGNYQLQVKAIGQSQVWTTPFTYSFVIRPAWWQTWWFKTLVVLFSLFLTFLAVRFIYLYRLRQQKTLLEKQLAVQLERQRISAEMHDDIGAGLSGVRLLTELTKNKMKDTGTTDEIDKIYQSVGDISAKMKEVIWSLNTENDSLDSLIAYLIKQARQMMEHYPAKFHVTVPEKTPKINISGEVRRHIYLSIKEALHNIIKHSGADITEMDIKCDDKLRIMIADNGKGTNTDENSSSGNGLKNMRKRMKEINGELIIENNNGFKLFFVIPFDNTL